MSKGGAAHGENPAGIFVQTNTVAADQEATRETPGTAEKRNTNYITPYSLYIFMLNTPILTGFLLASSP